MEKKYTVWSFFIVGLLCMTTYASHERLQAEIVPVREHTLQDLYDLYEQGFSDTYRSSSILAELNPDHVNATLSRVNQLYTKTIAQKREQALSKYKTWLHVSLGVCSSIAVASLYMLGKGLRLQYSQQRQTWLSRASWMGYATWGALLSSWWAKRSNGRKEADWNEKQLNTLYDARKQSQEFVRQIVNPAETEWLSPASKVVYNIALSGIAKMLSQVAAAKKAGIDVQGWLEAPTHRGLDADDQR